MFEADNNDFCSKLPTQTRKALHSFYAVTCATSAQSLNTCVLSGSPWKDDRGVLITFKAATVAWPLTAGLVPVPSRRVLSSSRRLLANGRIGRGGSWVSRVVVTWHRTPLKANDTPFGISQLQNTWRYLRLEMQNCLTFEVDVAKEFACGGRHAMGW